MQNLYWKMLKSFVVFLTDFMWCRSANFLNVYHSNVKLKQSPGASRSLQKYVRTVSSAAEFQICRSTSRILARHYGRYGKVNVLGKGECEIPTSHPVSSDLVHSRRRESHRKQMHVISPSFLE
jgi:hypothetical protein